MNWKRLEANCINPPPQNALWKSPWTQEQEIDLSRKWTMKGMVLLGADQLEAGASRYQRRPPVWIGSAHFHAETTDIIVGQAE